MGAFTKIPRTLYPAWNSLGNYRYINHLNNCTHTSDYTRIFTLHTIRSSRARIISNIHTLFNNVRRRDRHVVPRRHAGLREGVLPRQGLPTRSSVQTSSGSRGGGDRLLAWKAFGPRGTWRA